MIDVPTPAAPSISLLMRSTWRGRGTRPEALPGVPSPSWCGWGFVEYLKHPTVLQEVAESRSPATARRSAKVN